MLCRRQRPAARFGTTSSDLVSAAKTRRMPGLSPAFSRLPADGTTSKRISTKREGQASSTGGERRKGTGKAFAGHGAALGLPRALKSPCAGFLVRCGLLRRPRCRLSVASRLAVAGLERKRDENRASSAPGGSHHHARMPQVQRVEKSGLLSR